MGSRSLQGPGADAACGQAQPYDAYNAAPCASGARVAAALGPGLRKRVVTAIAAQWFKKVGAAGTLLPYAKTAPPAMSACYRDPADQRQRELFDLYYKAETSRASQHSQTVAPLGRAAACRR